MRTGLFPSHQLSIRENRHHCPARFFHQGGSDMGDKGSKDKGNREERKKAKHTLKEKRKIKNEKKQNATVTTI
jgi:hypothetical protein